jgi:hypothetical protein
MDVLKGLKLLWGELVGTIFRLLQVIPIAIIELRNMDFVQ